MSDNRILTQEEIQALVNGGLSEEDEGGTGNGNDREKVNNTNVPGIELYGSVQPEERGRGKEPRSHPGANLDLVLDMPLEISVILGSRKIDIKSLLEVSSGTLIELQKKLGDSVEIYTNGKLLARGEIVSMDENFGVRIKEIVKPVERLRALKSQ